MSLVVGAARYEEASTFGAYLATVAKHPELWQGVYRTAVVSGDSAERLRRISGNWRLLALSEDWCGDAVSILPVIARLAEQAGTDLRVLPRDANADLMDAHLTLGTRSVPVVLVLNDAYEVVTWWGPRPAVVQRWYRNEAHMLPKEERTRRKRAWYARDRGRTVVDEVVEAVERASRRVSGNGRAATR
jgi:hypothetical protein